jgi:hypothetical protein
MVNKGTLVLGCTGYSDSDLGYKTVSTLQL